MEHLQTVDIKGVIKLNFTAFWFFEFCIITWQVKNLPCNLPDQCHNFLGKCAAYNLECQIQLIQFETQLDCFFCMHKPLRYHHMHLIPESNFESSELEIVSEIFSKFIPFHSFTCRHLCQRFWSIWFPWCCQHEVPENVIQIKFQPWGWE